MKKRCTYFDRGSCRFGESCRFFHDKSSVDPKSVKSEFVRKTGDDSSFVKNTNFKPNNTNRDFQPRQSSECELFLAGKCNNSNCTNIHNFSRKYQKENNNEFAIKFNTFYQDFFILEPYEKKILGKTSLDVMFLMDCTGSMSSWIQKTCEEIISIMDSILENNPHTDINMCFIGYRDHCDGKIRFETQDFTSDIISLKKFINKVKASGGGDEPEDVAGALDIGLKMSWTASAKYAVLVSDAPCHGVKYHKVSGDSYPNGDPNGLVIEDLIAAYGEKGINLFGVKINDSTDLMYQKMSESYKKVTYKDIHVENLGTSTSNFSFFISFSASVTLGSCTYDKVRLEDLIEGIKKESIVKTQLNEDMILESKGTAQDEAERLKEFINRLSQMKNSEEKSGDEGRRIICPLPEDFEFPKVIKPPENWNLLSKDYECICYTWFIVKDRNVNIDWKNPLIQQSQIKSHVRIAKTPFSKGAMRYAYHMYDAYLEQKLVGKLPIEIALKDYTPQNLSKDIESLIFCQFLANDYNEKIINIIPETKLLLNFIHSYVYEIKEAGDFKYYAVENFIDGAYEKYSNNAGWISDSLSESSLIAQAFSHFTWQTTKGYIMVVDLQGVKGVLTDPQIHCLNPKKFGQGNLGYYGMMKFFMTHYCNKYCKKLNLAHPRKKVEINEKFDFFLDKYERPISNEAVFKLCDLCRAPFKTTSDKIFNKKVASQEMYCDECDEERKSSTKSGKCIDCKSTFQSSEYWFMMKRTDFPVRCSKCRLENRNRMRLELEKSQIKP